MDRRTTLLALAGTALPLLPRADAASSSAPSGIGIAAYRKSVLQYGTLAKNTSFYALKTSQDKYVQAFAHGEILEQTAIAQALTSQAKPPPASLTAAQQKALDSVRDATAGTVDAIYIQVQIAGHEALLGLQDKLLAGDSNFSADVVHIALIARAFIRNHLIALQLLAS